MRPPRMISVGVTAIEFYDIRRSGLICMPTSPFNARPSLQGGNAKIALSSSPPDLEGTYRVLAPGEYSYRFLCSYLWPEFPS